MGTLPTKKGGSRKGSPLFPPRKGWFRSGQEKSVRPDQSRERGVPLIDRWIDRLPELLQKLGVGLLDLASPNGSDRGTSGFPPLSRGTRRGRPENWTIFSNLVKREQSGPERQFSCSLVGGYTHGLTVQRSGQKVPVKGIWSPMVRAPKRHYLGARFAKLVSGW